MFLLAAITDILKDILSSSLNTSTLNDPKGMICFPQLELTLVIDTILKTNLPLSFLAGLLVAKAQLQGQRESLCRQQLHGLQSCTMWQ